MRIAMLSLHSCPLGKLGSENTGGMSVYIRELSRELGKRGHHVDVFTRCHGAGHSPVMTLGEKARLIHVRAGEERELDKTSIWRHMPEFVHRVKRFREESGVHYDLIHSHYWLSGWAGRHLASLWGVPQVMMFHTLGMVKEVTMGSREPQLRIPCERSLTRDSSLIIAPTEREKDLLLRYYGASPGNISVIPCGVNLELFRTIEKDFARDYLGFNGEQIILFVGRIVPLKGIDRLLLALSCLKPRDNLRLVVIGGDEQCQAEVDRLKNLSEDLRLKDCVSFLGLVGQEKLPYFYSAADLCVFPSYYESFGLVALESLACGTPVVATNVGDLENIILEGKTGYVVHDSDPGSLADKIALLLSLSKARGEAIGSIRSSIARYSWDNIAEAILGEYRRITANHRGEICEKGRVAP
ncbi:MAG: glycosyltransferase [Deltaproteobacteria bacterium]|nr:glycosyltransferase [Deltaproteobacteria bacterium]